MPLTRFTVSQADEGVAVHPGAHRRTGVGEIFLVAAKAGDQHLAAVRRVHDHRLAAGGVPRGGDHLYARSYLGLALQSHQFHALQKIGVIAVVQGMGAIA